MMRMSPRRASVRLRRGVSLLPSLFTIGNLLCGFEAVIRTLNGQYGKAAPFILGAGLLDVADGRIARLSGTTSEFGGELDSLADAVSFGVAPALLAYAWGMYGLPRIGQLTAFLFVVCGVARLARFNVQRKAVDGRHFVGLPIPAAAGLVAALVLLLPQRLSDRLPSTLVAVGTALVALLMVSTFRYPSFKNVDLTARRSYRTVLLIALCILLLASHPAEGLLSLATLYCVWGPAAYLVSLVRRRGDMPPHPTPVSHGAGTSDGI